MSLIQVYYKGGYKYQLIEECKLKVRVIPDKDIKTEFIELYQDGQLIIKKNYAWDGPSGPTIDTGNFMRGSLVHDALYQLMRNNLLSKDKWRKQVDLELKRICVEDGMSRLRALIVYTGVRLFGEFAASLISRKEILSAPD